MCLILVAWRVHPDYPLVLAANRDEFFDRPAAPAQWWEDAPDLHAGRDLEAGGTWLGMSRRGRFAGLTNYRDPERHRPGTPSRGALVADFLKSDLPLADAMEELARTAGDYNGFNLLASDGRDLAIFDNISLSHRILPPGVYGLSNHLLDSPWPKVERGKSRLSAALSALPEEEPLIHLLRDDRPAPDATLPRTGVSLAWERLLSSAFIRAPGYGTRCSTLILRDHEGRTRYTEITWDRVGREAGRITTEWPAQDQAQGSSHV